MKKIVKISLAAMMLFALVFLSFIPASAATDNWGGPIYTYDENGMNISIFREHTEKKGSGWKLFGWELFKQYDTRIKLEVNNGADPIKSYTSQKVSSFSSNPLTVKEVCKKEETLCDKDIYAKIESLCMYDEILRNPVGHLAESAIKSFEDLEKAAEDELSGIVDGGIQGIIEEAAATVNKGLSATIGIGTSMRDIVNARATGELFGGIMKENVWGFLEMLILTQDIAVQNLPGEAGKIKAKYDKLLSDAANDLFDAVCEIAN